MDFDKLIDEDIAGLAQIGVTLPLNAVVLRDYLPHRYPFMLLDRVTAVKPNEWITGLKNITINEPFFNGHFPEEPIMPGVLMIEAMAQVAGVLGFISKNVKPRDGYIYLFAGVDKVRFKRQVIPGEGPIRLRVHSVISLFYAPKRPWSVTVSINLVVQRAWAMSWQPVLKSPLQSSVPNIISHDFNLIFT